MITRGSRHSAQSTNISRENDVEMRSMAQHYQMRQATNHSFPTVLFSAPCMCVCAQRQMMNCSAFLSGVRQKNEGSDIMLSNNNNAKEQDCECGVSAVQREKREKRLQLRRAENDTDDMFV
ncbi:hypothetical protein TraAM80_06400 [Trypanosoma rangeli]|uniref:Uncharacterized protein n=1 Tax=Trypanosoma rangeli TaxID=5698 RepID=A0A422NAB4_TRYRA|nr:uncharacterized protein TraAM80_06400 [Trypanosoma rangeli]RNF02424.1 hypothetical protein TraAM80_06400 [Trypanosoma rangeli]|eukprot:RNF02424.1 hypothetical protein TraAM80_06400 [Trypanosoma rangeli]